MVDSINTGIEWEEPPVARNGKYQTLFGIYRANPGKWGRYNEKSWPLGSTGPSAFAGSIRQGGVVGASKGEFETRVGELDGRKWVWLKYVGA